MRYIALLLLCSLPIPLYASEEDEAEARLRLIAASRHREVKTDTPVTERPGFHQERGLDGVIYWIPDGFTFPHNLNHGVEYTPKGGQSISPFSQGGITPGTTVPNVAGVYTSYPVGIQTGHITIGARSMVRYGNTNCPPSG